MAKNPIFERALQHSRWPSLQTALRLFGAFVLLGLIYLWHLSVVDPDGSRDITENSWLIFGLLSLLVALLSAPLSALFTCLHLPNAITSSDFQTIRLTGLPRRKIVLGYLLISLYRLRLLWVLTFGMLFVLTLLLAHSKYIDGVFMISMTGGVMGISLNWLAICTGLWSSVCWGRRWIALLVTLAISGVALLVSLGIAYGILMSPFYYGDQWWGIPLLILLFSVVVSLSLLHQAEQQI